MRSMCVPASLPIKRPPSSARPVVCRPALSTNMHAMTTAGSLLSPDSASSTDRMWPYASARMTRIATRSGRSLSETRSPIATMSSPMNSACCGETSGTPAALAHRSPHAMVMLSELLRRGLVDQRGHRVRLLDLAVDLSAGDYPPVTRLFFAGPRGRQMELPWAAVVSSDMRSGRLRVADLADGRAAPPETLKRTVLLRRDVRDALLLELAQRHTMRANDLWLHRNEDGLWLRGADISPWAVLRRLGRG